MPGIFVVEGADLRLSNIRIELGDEGTLTASPLTMHLRTDMWPYWLAEAVSAAIAATEITPGITPELRESDPAEMRRLLEAELRASMRALTSVAFAIDAFYASVKARSPEHPQQAVWNEKETPRRKQVAETLRHHLRVTNNAQAKELSHRIGEIFRFRDWAVHPGSRYREPVYRPDIDAGVDWHFVVFSAANAIAGVAKIVVLIDFLVSKLDLGSEELAKCKPPARKAIDQILDFYEASDRLPRFTRAEAKSERPHESA